MPLPHGRIRHLQPVRARGYKLLKSFWTKAPQQRKVPRRSVAPRRITLTAFVPSARIDPQVLAITSLESPFLLHIRALHAALKGTGYMLEERLPPAKRSRQHDLSTAAYLQIAAEISPDRIIVLNKQKF